jgi:hypothetical protein
MTGVVGKPMDRLMRELEQAHQHAVSAAEAGLRDPALGSLRLTGTAVTALAEAAVSSATPFQRAPLLSRLSGVSKLHPTGSQALAECPSCRLPAPCPTALELDW